MSSVRLIVCFFVPTLCPKIEPEGAVFIVSPCPLSGPSDTGNLAHIRKVCGEMEQTHCRSET